MESGTLADPNQVIGGLMATRIIEGIEELKSLIGQEVAASDWLEVTQSRINDFADATDDHQWIHIDVERAKTDSPFHSTIAHGFLSPGRAGAQGSRRLQDGNQLRIEPAAFCFAGAGRFARARQIHAAISRRRHRRRTDHMVGDLRNGRRSEAGAGSRVAGPVLPVR